MQKRRLTINFQRSISGGKPQEMEVAVAPLSEPNAPNLNATLVGGTQVQSVLLAAENNPAYFDLVPTDHPALTERIPYRIAWREKFMGQQFTNDFVMPDFDCDYDDLQDLGNLIGGETYVQWSDRSRPGGVSGLNDAGQVIDAFGNPVTGQEAADVVQGNLNAEIVARQQADQAQNIYFYAYVNDQITQVYTSTTAARLAAVDELENADLIERTARQNADAALQAQVTANAAEAGQANTDVNDSIDQIEETLLGKADLVDGKIPTSQLPPMAIGHAVPVNSQAEMLALTPAEIQPGDFAVRPDGVFFLNEYPASDIGNWVEFQVAAAVSSVNGQTGAVWLSPADIGARSASQPVPMGDIDGLAGALQGKTNNSTTIALTQRVTAIEQDPSLVHKVGGLIPKADMPSDSAFINANNLVTKKDGTVIQIGEGGTLGIEDVGGLQEELDSKLDENDPSVTNARTPTAHADSHRAGGADPLLPITTTEVTGLDAILTNNLLTNGSNHGNRINSLESRVTVVEGGGAVGGGGISTKALWFDYPSAVTGQATPGAFQGAGVLQKGPFGQAAGGSYYYEPGGAAEGEWRFPYITPNGHLELRKWNETAPADPPTATQSALDATNALVALKASQADLDATNAAVGTKAAQSALDATNATVATKAAQSALDATNNAVSTKAEQSALDATNATVGQKANQSDLTALQTSNQGKASQTDLTNLTTRVTNIESNKANLVNGTVPLNELPNNIPITKVTGFDPATKANLVNGTVPLAELPANIPTSKITTGTTSLDAALNAKADLIGGVIPTSQLPAIAISETHVVANRGAMLALPNVQRGDVCVITATADKGSYILQGNDPTQFSSWVMLSTPDSGVASVNGQTGPAVVLSAADVGARPSGVLLGPGDLTATLNATINGKADKTYVDTELGKRATLTEVQGQLSAATPCKQLAMVVATTSVPSTAGQQSIDGVLVPVGAVVLLTAQPSSVNNGLWVVSNTAWTRATDMNNNDFFVKGSIVSIAQGTNNHDTIWQETNTSGVVGTNANNWQKIFTGGAPIVYTGSLGVRKVGNDFRAEVQSGGGIIVETGGLKLDPNVSARKFSVDVPAGSNPVTITHNLGTTDVQASFRDKGSGDAFLVGWKPAGINAISVEFNVAPTVGQYRVVVVG